MHNEPNKTYNSDGYNGRSEHINDKYIPEIKMAKSSMGHSNGTLYDTSEQMCYTANRVVSILENIEYHLFGAGDPSMGDLEVSKAPNDVASWDRETSKILLRLEALAQKLSNGIK